MSDDYRRLIGWEGNLATQSGSIIAPYQPQGCNAADGLHHETLKVPSGRDLCQFSVHDFPTFKYLLESGLWESEERWSKVLALPDLIPRAIRTSVAVRVPYKGVTGLKIMESPRLSSVEYRERVQHWRRIFG